MLTIYGTTTSPYVRRVRVVATELGLEHQLVSTATSEGQARLREVTPLWKVPVAVIDGQTVFDSRAIVDHLLRRHGAGPLRPLGDEPEATNVLTVIDGALDSLINAFYLAKDGVERAQASYLDRQHQRAKSALSWLEARLGGPHLGGEDVDGSELRIADIALVSALDWMCFRDAYPIDDHPPLAAFLRSRAERPSFAVTNPRD